MNLTQHNTKFLPDSPGVYFFLDKHKKPIYIGKATSLKDRVKSYFSSDLISTRGPILVKMLCEAVSIDHKRTDSVLEALLLEADLIKKFHPTYNTKEKDDKSFNCVVLTDEDFPQLLIVRKKDLLSRNLQLLSIFGPYPNGGELKGALKIVRKILPYRDAKCNPSGSSKNKNSKACFNYQIGLCPGVCVGAIDKKHYAVRVRRLKLFLSGKVSALIKDLERDMKTLAKEQKFESAKILRDKVYALEHINDISLIKNNSAIAGYRIEAYDIAHMSGQSMVGVMTVVSGGIPQKSDYKKFNIKSITGADDTGALKEILSRRFTHTEWQFPDLVVVDGGVAQLNMAKAVLSDLGLSIPIASVVKDDRHKPKGLLGDGKTEHLHKKEILLANSEAHRFAIAFHRKKRAKKFII